jgi:hypothetical protein
MITRVSLAQILFNKEKNMPANLQFFKPGWNLKHCILAIQIWVKNCILMRGKFKMNKLRSKAIMKKLQQNMSLTKYFLKM